MNLWPTSWYFLVCLSFLIIGACQEISNLWGFWNAIFGVAIYSVAILVHALVVSYFVPNIFVILVCYFSLVYDTGPVTLEKELVGVCEEKEEEKLKRRVNNRKYFVILWIGVFGCILEFFVIYLVKDLTSYDWTQQLINEQKHNHDLVGGATDNPYFGTDFLLSFGHLFLPGCQFLVSTFEYLLYQWDIDGIGAS